MPQREIIEARAFARRIRAALPPNLDIVALGVKQKAP
jgi:hypothetical protein